MIGRLEEGRNRPRFTVEAGSVPEALAPGFCSPARAKPYTVWPSDVAALRAALESVGPRRPSRSTQRNRTIRLWEVCRYEARLTHAWFNRLTRRLTHKRYITPPREEGVSDRVSRILTKVVDSLLTMKLKPGTRSIGGMDGTNTHTYCRAECASKLHRTRETTSSGQGCRK